MHHYFLLETFALFNYQLRRARFVQPRNVDRLNILAPQISLEARFFSYSDSYKLFFTKRLQKPKIFYLLCNSTEGNRTVIYHTKYIKGRRGLKGP